MDKDIILFVSIMLTIAVFDSSLPFIFSPDVNETAIMKCEEQLPRNKHCHLVAVPMEEK